MMLQIYDPATAHSRPPPPERDYGTPPPVPEYSAGYAALEQVSLSIDGRQVSVPKGTSVLRSVYVINRGYEDLAERLNALGAQIETFRDI